MDDPMNIALTEQNPLDIFGESPAKPDASPLDLFTPEASGSTRDLFGEGAFNVPVVPVCGDVAFFAAGGEEKDEKMGEDEVEGETFISAFQPQLANPSAYAMVGDEDEADDYDEPLVRGRFNPQVANPNTSAESVKDVKNVDEGDEAEVVPYDVVEEEVEETVRLRRSKRQLGRPRKSYVGVDDDIEEEEKERKKKGKKTEAKESNCDSSWAGSGENDAENGVADESDDGLGEYNGVDKFLRDDEVTLLPRPPSPPPRTEVLEMRSVHGAFVCEECDIHFEKNVLLTAHSRLHTGEKPYKCGLEECGKTFRWKTSLEFHEANGHTALM